MSTQTQTPLTCIYEDAAMPDNHMQGLGCLAPRSAGSFGNLAMDMETGYDYTAYGRTNQENARRCLENGDREACERSASSSSDKS